MIPWLLAAHVVVLGYWLGSELVINSTYRLVCFADDMPFAARSRLMDHVMRVDQHVRYALVLQATLGAMLAVAYGFFPGGQWAVLTLAVAGVAWLLFVEAVHHLHARAAGQTLARIDRVSRYLLMAILAGFALGWLGANWPIPAWLRFKLAAFAGVMACGVGIRLALIGHFRVWAKMASGDLSPGNNAVIQSTYWRATAILICLWVFIGIMTILSVAKPL